jgi:hypothetical protein
MRLASAGRFCCIHGGYCCLQNDLERSEGLGFNTVSGPLAVHLGSPSRLPSFLLNPVGCTGRVLRLGRASSLEKIPQPGEFNDLFSGQDGAN